MGESRQIGLLSLDARQNGRDYSQQDCEVLKQVAKVVALAVEQDSTGNP
jgi:hypothetical protein